MIRLLLPVPALLLASACVSVQATTTPTPAAQTRGEDHAAMREAHHGAGAGGISARQIDAHMRFLASDLLEGRAPATRGGRIAADYIASQLQLFGVHPAVGGSYFQPVPIDIVGADRARIEVSATGRATRRLRYPDEVVVWAGSATARSEATGELVFVGYGSAAPEYRWDDFKNVDVRGKVLLVLVNDPPAPASEPTLFGGRAMTYYGRWTYKYEEAERRGAAGMLIVHTTERAGYPWHTVVGSWAREQRMLPRPAGDPPPIGVRGWITDSAATALLSQAGLDMAQLRRSAESREFRPVPTGITINMSFPNTVQRLQAINVVGVVRGSDPQRSDEYVAYSAHFDHLGIGPPVNGDSIYNGALDNASGVAAMLAVAHSAAHDPKPARSQLFVFVDAEESGLLGSKYFAENPTVPVHKIVANLNVDLILPSGVPRSLQVLGENKSSLGRLLADFVRPGGVSLEPDPTPEVGSFYRSDHFSFAKVGVPAVSIGPGSDFANRPAGWGLAQTQDYRAHRYHQPSDEYRDAFDLSGFAWLADIVYRFGTSLANSATIPEWSPDAEFRRPGPR